MKLPISVWSQYYVDETPFEAVELLAEAGYRYLEFGHRHAEWLLDRGTPEAQGKAYREFTDGLGMKLCQGHLSYKQGIVDDAAMEIIKPQLVLFHALGITKAVLHVNGGLKLPEEERYAKWMKYLGELSDFVDGTGITLCLENLNSNPQVRSADGLLQVIRDAGDKNFGICLDTGHLHLSNKEGHIVQTQGEFIRKAGHYLQALHIQDNNGLGDVHQMPYSARYGIDWQDVMRGLREIGYKDLFNLEILGERGGPRLIKRAKLAFLHTLTEYMLTDEFMDM